jgi:transcriptional regulator GlxA family with amidase domain
MQLKKEDLEKAKQIQEFLEKNYQQRYGYQDLVKIFAVNKNKLKLAFTAVTNDTIHAFLTRVRIEHAKKLLLTTNLNIESIAEKVGLDKSNFNIQFKKSTGKTPSHWRNNPFPDFKLYREEFAVNKKNSG